MADTKQQQQPQRVPASRSVVAILYEVYKKHGQLAYEQEIAPGLTMIQAASNAPLISSESIPRPKDVTFAPSAALTKQFQTWFLDEQMFTASGPVGPEDSTVELVYQNTDRDSDNESDNDDDADKKKQQPSVVDPRVELTPLPQLHVKQRVTKVTTVDTKMK